jgi:hypothetical protein
MSLKRDSKQIGAVGSTDSSAKRPMGALPESKTKLPAYGDYADEALFSPHPSKPPTRPSSSSQGALRRVLLPAPMAPPPPPKVEEEPLDSYSMDLDFSGPIDVTGLDFDSPAQPEPSTTSARHGHVGGFDDGPSVETTLSFEDSDDDSESRLQPIDEVLAAATPSEPADATEIWSLDLAHPPTEAIGLDEGDMLGDELGFEAEIPLNQGANVASLRELSIPAPARGEVAQRSAQPAPTPAPAPTPTPPAGAPRTLSADYHVPAPPPPPAHSVAPDRRSKPAIDVAARRIERANRARALIAAGQYVDAQDIIELLRASGDDGLADELDRECALLQESASDGDLDPVTELGGMGAVLTVTANSSAIRTMNLDHRAGFLLSMIDGVSSVEDLCDVSNMSMSETLSLLVDLKRRSLLA